jgi:hypothetical protein
MGRALLASVTLTVLLGTGTEASGASFELCGSSGCTAVTTRAKALEAIVFGDVPGVPPQPVAPYYELRFPFGDRVFFVPSRQALKPPLGATHWRRVDEAAFAGLAPILARVDPWPPPVLTEVVVGGRLAADAQLYLRLYDALPAVAPPRGGPPGLWIVLRSERASPWSVSIPVPFPKRTAPWVNGFNLLEYLPEHRVLNRNGEYVRLPADLASVIERDAGLADVGDGPGRWWLVAAAVLALAAVAAGLVFARRPIRRR